ncbi:hypothetical protein BJX65DRAFT_270142 [Aspergillus insuetus]
MASHSSPANSASADLTAANATPQSRKMIHPRKRAVTACQHCRVRKIKCTNERPECRSCVRLKAKCSYDPRMDHSSFDPASLLILEKLNEVLRKLDQEPDEKLQRAAVSEILNGDNNPANTPAAPGAVVGDRYDVQAHVPPALDALQVPSSFTSTDSVLAWPIFGNRFRRGYLAEELFIAGHLSSQVLGHPFHVPSDYANLHRGGICEEDIPGLITKFLHLVHIKNPILDTKLIRRYASRVTENGLSWDAPSCLVLLACALGAIAAPFNGRPGIPEQYPASPAQVIGSDKATAENYYQLACRRLGLLQRSVTASQCYLLSGIFLMYTMRPLDAQSHFYQASSIYATYLKGQLALQQRRGLDDQPLGSDNRRLEQCLYWTCFKSECEFRLELDLPVSVLSTLAYPYMFPSPPTPDNPIEPSQENGNLSILSSPLSSSSFQQGCQTFTYSTLQEAEEQSWYYYLSEIALRRVGNRVSHYFYQDDNNTWSQMNIYETSAIVEDLEQQLESWKSTVPTRFRGVFSSEEKDELGCMIYGRYLDIKSHLYRPFLYYAVHHGDCNPEVNQIVEPLARKSLKSIVELTNTGTFYHRHHGTWLSCRQLTSIALLLLAANMSGLIPRLLSDGSGEFGQSFKICLDVLKYWESESPDIVRAREVVELLQDQILGHER